MIHKHNPERESHQFDSHTYNTSSGVNFQLSISDFIGFLITKYPTYSVGQLSLIQLMPDRLLHCRFAVQSPRGFPAVHRPVIDNSMINQRLKFALIAGIDRPNGFEPAGVETAKFEISLRKKTAGSTGFYNASATQPSAVGWGGRPPQPTSVVGWGGRIRTCECRYQKPVPYHLATPQQAHPRMCGRGALIAKESAKGSASTAILRGSV